MPTSNHCYYGNVIYLFGNINNDDFPQTLNLASAFRLPTWSAPLGILRAAAGSATIEAIKIFQ
jgi:hypothetical protein